MELVDRQPTPVLRFTRQISAPLFFSLSAALCVTLQAAPFPQHSLSLSLPLFLKWWRLRRCVEAPDLLRNTWVPLRRGWSQESRPSCIQMFLGSKIFHDLTVAWLLLRHDVSILQGHLKVIASFLTLWKMLSWTHTHMHMQRCLFDLGHKTSTHTQTHTHTFLKHVH